MIRAAVFDVDGTLYDQRSLRLRMAGQLLASLLSSPLPTWRDLRAIRAFRAAQEQMRGTASPARDLHLLQLSHASERTGLSIRAVDSAVQHWMQEVALKHLSSCRRPHLRELLRELRERDVLIAALSDYPAWAKLRALGVAEFFDEVVCAQDAEVQCFKPNPQGLKYLLDRLGVGADETLLIGDRPQVDGILARRLGVACCLIGSGVGESNPIGVRISGFEELCASLSDPSGLIA